MEYFNKKTGTLELFKKICSVVEFKNSDQVCDTMDLKKNIINKVYYEDLKQISNINLSGNNFCGPDLVYIKELIVYLNQYTKIKTLNLSDNFITGEDTRFNIPPDKNLIELCRMVDCVIVTKNNICCSKNIKMFNILNKSETLGNIIFLEKKEITLFEFLNKEIKVYSEDIGKKVVDAHLKFYSKK